MTLENKKIIVRNLYRLGMEIEKAYLIAECSDSEIDTLRNDPIFKKKMETYKAEEERRLLKLHSKACKIAAEKGSTAGIQWKLAKLNPEVWGDKKETGDGEGASKVIITLPSNGR